MGRPEQSKHIEHIIAEITRVDCLGMPVSVRDVLMDASLALKGYFGPVKPTEGWINPIKEV